MKLIELGLGERELVGKIVRFVCQHFQVVRRSRVETLLGKLRCIARCFGELLFLNPKLAILPISYERI